MKAEDFIEAVRLANPALTTPGIEGHVQMVKLQALLDKQKPPVVCFYDAGLDKLEDIKASDGFADTEYK